ncbi:MAG: RNHCP domain-containing protein [Patescibacteria group bacterium]|jgi:hypothetical protein
MKKFQRTIENFVCEFCGTNVIGNGYTNHCPECFTSKHVDINPGDRLAKCNGLMKPVDLFLDHGNWILTQRCEQCKLQKNNRVQINDNQEKLALLKQKLNMNSILTHRDKPGC